MAPLVLTVHFDPPSQTRLDADRQAYFPSKRNIVPAHLTLFHQLPYTESTSAELTQVAMRQPAFAITVTGLIFLGRGVAYTLTFSPLLQLRAQLAKCFAPHLIPQDRRPFRPHIVIQNKTTPEIARVTIAEITSRFVPFTIEAMGMDLWRYMDGPWTLLKTFTFDPNC